MITNSDDLVNGGNKMIPHKKMTYPLPHVVQDNYKEQT